MLLNGSVPQQELDSRLFKAFLAAAETLNFTLAAKKAHMTQSGVSQHIQRLEEQMRVSLFKRLGRQIALTAAGHELARHVREQTNRTTHFLESIRAESASYVGTVSYAMPPTCMLSPHFPMLLEKRKDHPDILLSVHLVTSSRAEEMITESHVDFGFINDKPHHPALQAIPFCQEEYVVVTADAKLAQSMTRADLPRQRFIVYPGNDWLLEHWFRHHCPRVHWRRAGMRAAGSIDQVQGAVVMALNGVGLLAIQRHCIESHLQCGALHEIRFSRQPLLNDVYIVKLANHLYLRRVEQVISWFLEMRHEPRIGMQTHAKSMICER